MRFCEKQPGRRQHMQGLPERDLAPQRWLDNIGPVLPG